jgi:hypothetical protein
MRVVDDARNTCINASQGRDQIADVHVLRTIVKSKSLMSRGHVLADFTVWDDATEHAFP